jgi:hypothetical protein
VTKKYDAHEVDSQVEPQRHDDFRHGFVDPKRADIVVLAVVVVAFLAPFSFLRGAYEEYPLVVLEHQASNPILQMLAEPLRPLLKIQIYLFAHAEDQLLAAGTIPPGLSAKISSLPSTAQFHLQNRVA